MGNTPTMQICSHKNQSAPATITINQSDQGKKIYYLNDYVGACTSTHTYSALKMPSTTNQGHNTHMPMKNPYENPIHPKPIPPQITNEYARSIFGPPKISH